MAAKANVIGIYIKDGGTLTLGRESTVADDGVAGINLRAYLSTSFIVIDDESGANLNGNTAGSNTSSSRENQVVTTGYDTNDKNVEIFADSMDAGIIKFKINHSAANKTVKLEDTGLSDVTFDTGTTSVLASNISTSSAIIVGSNAGSANSVLDVSSNNYSIRCGQGMTLYNGGTLLARAATLYLGTTDSSPYAGENSSRYGLFVSSGKVGGTSTSAAPTGTWYVSSIRNTSSGNILRFTTGTCTITGKNTSSNRFFEITDGNIYHSNGTITIDSGVAAEMQWDAASTDQDNGPYNFIINDASCTARIRSPLEILNDLDVTTGTFNTHSNDGGADKDLTVAGAVHIHSGGTLTCNTSTVSAYSMTVESSGTLNATSGTTTITGGGSPNYLGVSIKDGATFDNNNGTFQIDSSSESWLHRNVDNLDLVFHHLIINGANVYIQKGDIHCEGNLTINAGKALTPYNNHNNLRVDGDVILSGTLGKAQWGLDEPTRAACTFGGLKLNSGSTFIATQNTTTITNRITGESHLWKNDGGTFTHNNGIVRFTDNDHSSVKENTFYNVEVASANANQYAVAFEAQGGGGNAFTILGDLTIESGDFELINANDTLDIHGHTIIDNTLAGGSPNNAYARFNNDKNQTGTITHHGLVTVKSGTYHVEDGGTVNMAGIRNVGGVID